MIYGYIVAALARARGLASRIVHLTEPELLKGDAALAWHQLQRPGWKPKHAADVLHSLEAEVFPSIGAMALAEIRPADVRTVLEAAPDAMVVSVQKKMERMP